MRFLSERFLQEYPQANLVLLILDLNAQSNPFKPDDVRTEGARHQERPLVDWDDPRIYTESLLSAEPKNVESPAIRVAVSLCERERVTGSCLVVAESECACNSLLELF